MFKILVADDERFIRQGIVAILAKNIPEQLRCIEAANGIEALEHAERERPDLVITDICMPGCDGLEFISKLKDVNSRTPVIILSGYENFDYAKRAIKLGVKEYVMKPIKKTEFIELIESYIFRIKEQEQKFNAEAIRRIENAKIMEKLKADFLLGLLKCANKEEAEQYLSQLESVGMKFTSKYYTCVVTEYIVNEDTVDYMDFAVKNVLDEYLSLKSEEFLINVHYGNGVLVSIFESDSREALEKPKKRIMLKAVQLVKDYCKTPVYAGLGDIAYDSVHLYKAIRHAMYAADLKILERGETVSVYEECVRSDRKPETRIATEIKKVAETDVYRILQSFQEVYNRCRKENNVTALRQEYEETAEYFRRKKNISMQSEEWNKQPEKFSSFFTLSQLKREVKELMQEAAAEQQGEEGSLSNTALMKKILQYVDEHITEDLDLVTVAEMFKRTPGYISTLFKKHVEGGFNYYINKERMIIAKKLLKDHSLSIQEVSELTGYSNAKYFSVVFKKITGMTPRGYREKNS